MSDAQTQKPAAPAAGRAGMKKELPEHFKAYQHVWVALELERGQVHPVSFELLGEGRKLADTLGVELAGVVLGPPGPETDQAVREAFAYGADLAYLVEDPLLKDYRNEPYTKALTDLVNTFKPEILLLGATTLGRDLAGSVATTLKTGLTADCTELAVDADKSLAATRPTFGGSLLCTIYTLNYRPQMATVRPRVMAMPPRLERPVGRVIRHALDMREDDIVTKILSFVPDAQSNTVNLAFADLVVAGGLASARPAISSSSGPWRAPSARTTAARGPWSRKAGCRPSGRSARRERPSARSSTSPPASPVPSSTGSASRARI